MTLHADSRWAMVAMFTTWLVGLTSANDRDELLAIARNGNRAAIQAIQTMECRYERTPGPNTSLDQAKAISLIQTKPGQFWRSGEVFRFQEHFFDLTTLEYLFREGRLLILRSGGPLRSPTLAICNPRRVDGIGGAMWQYLLFSHWGKEAISFLPYHDLVQQSHTVHSVVKLPQQHNTIHIDLSHANGRLQFWFDPKVNYLIRKSTLVPQADTTYRHEYEVLEFAEPVRSVFVPTLIEHRCYHKGQFEGSVRTQITDLKVNHKLPTSALRLPGINGMMCIDQNREVKYLVDADGRRAGPETREEVVSVDPRKFPIQQAGLAGVDTSHLTQPSEPSTPWWIWILVISLGCLMVGLGIQIARRRTRAES